LCNFLNEAMNVNFFVETIRSFLLDDVIMHCVLCSNLCHKNKFLKALVLFRFLRIGIKAVRSARHTTLSSKFLWLNNCIRFKGSYAPTLILDQCNFKAKYLQNGEEN